MCWVTKTGVVAGIVVQAQQGDIDGTIRCSYRAGIADGENVAVGERLGRNKIVCTGVARDDRDRKTRISGLLAIALKLASAIPAGVARANRYAR